MAANLCRVCQVPVLSPATICQHCFAKLYPHALRRRLDTQHARAVARDARDYERAREADEADAPPKHRGHE